MNSQMLMIFVGIAAVAGVAAGDCRAQSAGSFTAEPADPGFAARLDADRLQARVRPGSLGLKSWSNANGEQGIPSGLGYRNNTNDVTTPADYKTDWSVGMRFNLNSSPTVDSSPNTSLGLQRKPAPGLVFERRF